MSIAIVHLIPIIKGNDFFLLSAIILAITIWFSNIAMAQHNFQWINHLKG